MNMPVNMKLKIGLVFPLCWPHDTKVKVTERATVRRLEAFGQKNQQARSTTGIVVAMESQGWEMDR